MAQGQLKQYHHNLSARQLFKSTKMRCFYTGINLHFDGSRTTATRGTVEHLIPVSVKRRRAHDLRINLVPAASLVNGMIGNAPLVVKYELKEYFKNIHFHPSLPDKALATSIKNTMRAFLSKYKHHGYYVWAWKGYQARLGESQISVMMKTYELYERYLLLLTQEELDGGMYVKMTKKIRLKG